MLARQFGQAGHEIVGSAGEADLFVEHLRCDERGGALYGR